MPNHLLPSSVTSLSRTEARVEALRTYTLFLQYIATLHNPETVLDDVMQTCSLCPLYVTLEEAEDVISKWSDYILERLAHIYLWKSLSLFHASDLTTGALEAIEDVFDYILDFDPSDAEVRNEISRRFVVIYR